MEPSTKIHDALKPVQWLIGKWLSVEGNGITPRAFKYCEKIEFNSIGQPIVNYFAQSWHPEKKTPMHLESGFLRIKPDSTQLAFMVSHNFGLTSLEEGNVAGNKISLKSVSISRMAFAKDPVVTELERTFTLLEDGKLEQVVCMATGDSPISEHLRCTYNRLPSGDS